MSFPSFAPVSLGGLHQQLRIMLTSLLAWLLLVLAFRPQGLFGKAA